MTCCPSNGRAGAPETLSLEERLAESEGKYRAICESSLLGIYIHQEGGLVYANARLGQILGYPRVEEQIGRSIVEFVHPDDQDKVQVNFQDRLRGKSVPDVYEIRMLHSSGSPIWTEILVSLIQHQGRPAVMGHVIDITRRKRMEEETARLEAQLLMVQKMEVAGKIASGVAHDFNNLLTGISGFSELLLMTLDPADERVADLLEIKRATERGAWLTGQLLAFTRKQVAAPRLLQLNELISQAQKMLRRILGEHVEVLFAPGADLWPLYLDPGQVEQILINLATNAAKAMPSGGKLFFETQNARGDPTGDFDRDGVLLVVADTGSGMDEETLARIFEPFFSTKSLVSGARLGIGLSVVQTIVQASGGRIDVRSRPGEGTTFRLHFPRAIEAHWDLGASPGEDLRWAGVETVLVAEDDGMVRSLVKKLLERHGYRVLTAVDGEDALELTCATGDEVQVLLTDVVMPRMNGRELHLALLERYPAMKVLFMSGYTDSIIGQHGVLTGDIPFIQKPFQARILLQKLRAVLDSGG